MFSRLQRKIEQLRREPEHIRLQAAIRYTILGGIIIVILWLAIFLPWQMKNALS